MDIILVETKVNGIRGCHSGGGVVPGPKRHLVQNPHGSKLGGKDGCNRSCFPM